MIKISIITITYNSEKTLEQTILSVINQDYENIEYIIIDGGSTDGTINLIKKYQPKISYWHSEKDKGIADAMNKGIAAATGDIIGIIHSDDFYEPNAFKQVAECFKNTNADIICGNLQMWKNGNLDYIFLSNPLNIKYDMTINHPTVFVKKNAYIKLGNFNTEYKYSMDYDLLLRFYLNGAKFTNINSVLANMRLDGISDRNWHKSMFEMFKIKLKNKISFLSALFYFIKQFIRMSISRLLLKLKLEFIIEIYRKYFSIMKKQKIK